MGSIVVPIENSSQYTKSTAWDTAPLAKIFIQFVPATVTLVFTEKYSFSNGSDGGTNCIKAIPDDGYMPTAHDKDYGNVYKPLFRGISDIPAINDKVLVCTFSGTDYYIGPLNNENSPEFNEDDTASSPLGKSLFSNFSTTGISRLQKINNPILDDPAGKGNYRSNENIQRPNDPKPLTDIHGDLMLEGRHGNSIRIGSRDVNPYMIISNGRNTGQKYESALDGTVMGMFENGSIRNHFFTDEIKKDSSPSTSPIPYNFTLADQEYAQTVSDGSTTRNIVKTFAKPWGSGRKLGSGDVSMTDDVYNYADHQLFASSNRITFNARSDSIFLSAYKFIHIGAGNNITLSSSNTLYINTNTSVITETGLFKVNAADKAWIDGRNAIYLGNQVADGDLQPAVLGDGLVNVIAQLCTYIKDMAMATSWVVEGKDPGNSVDVLNDIVGQVENFLGEKMVEVWLNNEAEQQTEQLFLPANIRAQILSKKVWISEGRGVPTSQVGA